MENIKIKIEGGYKLCAQHTWPICNWLINVFLSIYLEVVCTQENIFKDI